MLRMIRIYMLIVDPTWIRMLGLDLKKAKVIILDKDVDDGFLI